jgi:hypothetical protein
MKAVIRVAALAVLLGVLAQCQMPRSTGLAGPFGPMGTGSTTLLVAEGVPVLYLGGTVQVVSGELRVVVTPPTGPDAYNELQNGPAAISTTFPNPKAGTWQLRIESVSGTGEYSLRMYY